jgi:two-component system, sensor histidine kinase and response regulator
MVMRDVLDPTALSDLLAASGDDHEAVEEVVDTFIAAAPRQLAAMRRAIEADSAEDLLRPARTLGGEALTMGAVGLAELCRQIEELARRGAVDEAAARMAQTEAAWGDAVAALEAAREADWDVS